VIVIRKVFLELLPHRGSFVNWKECIGREVDFIYDESKGIVRILDYNLRKHKVTIQYKDEVSTIMVSSFSEGKLCSVLGIKIQRYYYDIGNIIKNSNGSLKILEQIRMNKKQDRGYNYECCNCHYTGTITEGNLRDDKGCPVCKNKKVKIGINDMWTTNPEMARMLKNKDDGYKYVENSNKRVDWICPQCNNIIKQRQINYTKVNGLSCGRCSDGISIPNKFMYNLLLQLGQNFSTETSFKWSNGKRYDFYLLDHNCLVEMQGGYHFQDSKVPRNKERDEQKNDELKKTLATNNNIDKYIQIDARVSELELMKNSILNSQLKFILDLDKIDWNKCFQDSLKSLVIIINEYWCKNINSTTSDMAKIFKINVSTIMKYLKQGSTLGLCDYTTSISKKRAKINMCKKIICINTNNVFKSLREASNWGGVKSTSGITACLKGERKFAGRNPITNEQLRWKYYDEIEEANL